MNIQEYISSGIIEAYVLGALPRDEQQQVANDLAMYPELKKEALEAEETLFRFCQLHAVTPPAALQQKIEQALPGLQSRNTGSESGSLPQGKTIPLSDYRKPTIVWRNAAAILVLLGSLAVNYYFYTQGREVLQEKTALEQQMNKLQADQKQMADLLASYRSSKAMMADTGIQTIVMHTMQPGHPMAATLYWSKDKGDAYVAMDALPKPPKGMQYQLWVIQKGKPVSMGMLPNDMADSPVMEKVNMTVTEGDAFAISLEKRGGNPTPTTVYVLGKA